MVGRVDAPNRARHGRLRAAAAGRVRSMRLTRASASRGTGCLAVWWTRRLAGQAHRPDPLKALLLLRRAGGAARAWRAALADARASAQRGGAEQQAADAEQLEQGDGLGWSASSCFERARRARPERQRADVGRPRTICSRHSVRALFRCSSRRARVRSRKRASRQERRHRRLPRAGAGLRQAARKPLMGRSSGDAPPS